jgi:hypothetical protein
MGIGADCSMGIARYIAQQRVQLDERGQGDLRVLGETHADASLALGHPFRDEDQAPMGRDAHESSVAGGGHVRSRGRQRLAAEGMPQVVDGDRS